MNWRQGMVLLRQAVLALVIFLALVPPAGASSAGTQTLLQRIAELYRAGQFADAVPLAEKLLGRSRPPFAVGGSVAMPPWL